jgi:hypothetical protein
MKPRQKVVTVEDITSSLYFLHVEQPEDANLVAPPQFQEPDYQEHDTPKNHHPLPPVPAVHRKAIPGVTSLPPRKPVSNTLTPTQNNGSRQNVSAGNYSQQPGMLTPNRQPFEDSRYQRENYHPNYSPNRSPERPRPSGTSLTLIRRDPASGAQWNVARIEDPSLADISSSAINDPRYKKKTGAPMYIDVTNPGYSKFLQSENVDRPTLPTRPSNLSTLSYQAEVTLQPQIPAPHPESQVSGSANVFRRRLWMEGSQFASGGFGHRKNGSYDFNSARPDSRGSYDAPSSLDDRPMPSSSFLTRDDQTYSTIQASDRPTSFRGYVFTSPWNGRCEFVTGAGGGSLKVSTTSCFFSHLLIKQLVSPHRPRPPRLRANRHARQRTPLQSP